jgi:hypothetical protein
MNHPVVATAVVAEEEEEEATEEEATVVAEEEEATEEEEASKGVAGKRAEEASKGVERPAANREAATECGRLHFDLRSRPADRSSRCHCPVCRRLQVAPNWTGVIVVSQKGIHHRCQYGRC